MANNLERGTKVQIVAMLAEPFQKRRQRVVTPLILREKILRQQTKVVADAKHAPWLSARSGAGREPPPGGGSECRRHCLQQRQRQGYTGRTKEFTPG